MTGTIKLLSLLLLVMSLQGCLVFKTVSYKIHLNDANSGTVNMDFKDIRSDAADVSQLEQDKKQLFQDMAKSDEFVSQMKSEGRNILSRNLYVSNGTLNGSVSYSFNDISSVENLVYQEPFYYVTFGLEDSIISTNGEIILSDDYKRIVWDNSITTLEFEWFSTNTDNPNLVELVKYYDQEK